mmetsp:Transcript_43256/g.115993  ORF Transcript_43256/g.115993 Transcript_43256/m.115993 type:complete len:218 (+) Transcript_43256:615-1268(+)
MSVVGGLPKLDFQRWSRLTSTPGHLSRHLDHPPFRLRRLHSATEAAGEQRDPSAGSQEDPEVVLRQIQPPQAGHRNRAPRLFQTVLLEKQPESHKVLGLRLHELLEELGRLQTQIRLLERRPTALRGAPRPQRGPVRGQLPGLNQGPLPKGRRPGAVLGLGEMDDEHVFSSLNIGLQGPPGGTHEDLPREVPTEGLLQEGIRSLGTLAVGDTQPLFT